jgi:hypothetical protein
VGVRASIKSALGEMWRLTPSFVLLTVFGGLITYWYQGREARANRQAQEIEAARVGATDLFAEASTVLGRNVYLLNREVLWLTDSLNQPFVTRDRLDFDKTFFENSARYRALMCRFFGPVDAKWLHQIFAGLHMLKRYEVSSA